MAKGIDPETAEEAAGQAELRKAENTVGVVVEEFFVRHLRKTRQGHSAEILIRREFVSRWADRPITEITRRDVLAGSMPSLIAANHMRHTSRSVTLAAFQLGDCSRRLRA